jgi:uncharacterized protein DUF6438
MRYSKRISGVLATLALSCLVYRLAVGQQPGSATPPSTLAPQEVESADSLVLERTGCFGTCPAYRLRITRSGAVHFRSREFSDTGFIRTASIPSDSAQALLTYARLMRFTDLPARIEDSKAYCPSRWTDHPTAIITIYGAGWSKQVVDYYGCWWAPEALRRFEEQLDKTARVSQWLRTR